MNRLTNDNPQDNFSTTLNYVYGKGGWAQIRFVGDEENVPLTDYMKRLCIERGCTTMADLISPEEIDEILCDCAFDNGGCPVFLAYTFACQAVHLRSRCKLYEDILYDENGQERLSLEELKTLVQAKEKYNLCNVCGANPLLRNEKTEDVTPPSEPQS